MGYQNHCIQSYHHLYALKFVLSMVMTTCKLCFGTKKFFRPFTATLDYNSLVQSVRKLIYGSSITEYLLYFTGDLCGL